MAKIRNLQPRHKSVARQPRPVQRVLALLDPLLPPCLLLIADVILQVDTV